MITGDCKYTGRHKATLRVVAVYIKDLCQKCKAKADQTAHYAQSDLRFGVCQYGRLILVGHGLLITNRGLWHCRILPIGFSCKDVFPNTQKKCTTLLHCRCFNDMPNNYGFIVFYISSYFKNSMIRTCICTINTETREPFV